MAHRYFHLPALLALLLPALLCAQKETPRNIILLIGDGMGTAQLSAHVLQQKDSRFHEFPVAGFSMTQSANAFVTESAAGATALATGRRTVNGHLSLSHINEPLTTLLEAARAYAGKATGVVATSSITHATPAAFLAHVDSRKKEFEIAEQIASSGVDVAIGGGRRFFLPAPEGARTDGTDLLAAMRARGYDVRTELHDGEANARTTEAATGAAAGSAARRSIILMADEGLPKAGERSYSLGDMIRVALAALVQDSDGFVLMVEGSQIDWAAHANDLPQLHCEMADFETALAAALDFAARDRHTLVVVTADHETGGLSLTGKTPDGSDMNAHWAGDDHTGAMVPLFAFGPGSTRFGGIHRNEEIGKRLMELIQGR